MNLHSLLPFTFLLLPFVIAFLLEAVVIYAMKLKRFWPAVGLSVGINLVSLAVTFYVITEVLSGLHYEFNGLELPPQVVIFLWWFSTVLELALLRLLLPKAPAVKRVAAAMLMNAASTAFLYVFVINSHG